MLGAVELITLLLLGGAGDEMDESPARVPLEPLPLGWRIMGVDQCESAERVVCRIARFPRAYGGPDVGKPSETGGQVRIAYASAPRGALKQAIGPPFTEWNTFTFGDAPVGHVALCEDYILFVPRTGNYDPSWVEPSPRGWQWGSGDPKAPPMPREVVVAVAGELGEGYAVHRDPRDGALDYYRHPDRRRLPKVPVAVGARVIAIGLQHDGAIHAIVQDKARVLYVTNKSGKPTCEQIASSEELVRASISVDDSEGVHAICVGPGTAGVQYWKSTPTPAGARWAKVLLARGDNLGDHLRICAGHGDDVHVLYSSPHGLEYMRLHGAKWVRYRIWENAVAGCDIAVDEPGYVHACFASDKGALKYATDYPAPEEGR